MAIHSQYVTGRKVSILYVYYVYQEANIRSAYNLCSSIPFEELTASLGSAYMLSILAEEVVASPEAADISLCTLAASVLTPTPASVYTLATAVT